jgi:zinc/manganese transport system substrate-binding protein
VPKRIAVAQVPKSIATIAVAVALLFLGGCGDQATSGRLTVVAAENFWGSIASQLAGPRATVRSIIVNPAQDPHSYEPLPTDARVFASARLAIVNGIGYDPWASQLLAANPVSGRIALNVGELFGLHDGDNPHRWYDPAEVIRVAATITADLKRLDPRNAAYYERRLATFDGRSLQPYQTLIAQIRSRYAGVPVGASESIFAPLAPTLGLRLLTPSSFMDAISEGSELTAQDILATERQISAHEIKVWIYNSQNATPEITRLNSLARAHGIPIATVTETLQPATDSFEQWQVAQLQAIERALCAATGR